jgi:hypothetical protein
MPLVGSSGLLLEYNFYRFAFIKPKAEREPWNFGTQEPWNFPIFFPILPKK